LEVEGADVREFLPSLKRAAVAVRLRSSRNRIRRVILIETSFHHWRWFTVAGLPGARLR
jgi:hypothetical protein